MIKTTTQKDLILYAYNETGLTESDRVQRNIDGDPLVQQDFSEVINAMNSLEEIRVEPSEESINKILAFSKSMKR